MERTGRDVARYLDAQVVSPQAEQVRHLIAEASRVNGNQPVVINLQLPAEQAKPVRERRDIDWVAIAFIAIPAFVVLVLALFVFVGCMSQSPPPPPPVVHKSMPSCVAACW